MTHGRVLLIVDYAETRLGLVEMLRAVAADTGRALRVLLLARHAGDWWQRLEASESAVRAMVSDANRLIEELPLVTESGLTDLDVVRRAMPFFAVALKLKPPGEERVILIGNQSAARVLDLHAAALVAVLGASEQPAGAELRIDLATVLEDLLRHEKRYWLGRAEALEVLKGPHGLTAGQLSQIVAAGCLLGATTQSDAMKILGRVPHVSPSLKLADWLHELYPPAPGEGWLGSLRPDRLTELHVTRELDESPELAEACLTDLDERQASRALILLARASGEYPTAQQLLEPALFNFAEVIPAIKAPQDTMIAIANAIPSPSTALGEAHAVIVARILAAQVPGTAEEAAWLHSYGWLLSGLGRREQALAAIERAVEIRRKLANGSPERFLPDLGMSLNNQSDLLLEMGQREQALAAAMDAVAIHRRLAGTQPVAFLPELAGSLNNQSNSLSGLGRREEALAAITEAVGIHREFAAIWPDAFLPGLAMSLNNQSNDLSGLGRPEEALAAITEAVAIRRELANARPDAFLPTLAVSLTNQSVYFSGLQRLEEALVVAQEATSIYRGLAQSQSEAFLSDLASSLNNEAASLSYLGRREEALSVIGEAVSIRRELAQVRPEAFLPGLATSLNNQSERLSDLGRRVEALTAIEEATGIFRELAAAYPDVFLPGLATSLSSQSARLWDLGRRGESLIVSEGAVGIYRRLTQDHPDAFRPDLATTLNNHAIHLSSRRRRDEALSAIKEAVAIRRELAAIHPDTDRPDLAMSLSNYASQLSELERWEEALAVSEEATGIYRRQAHAHPDAFLPELAASLNNHSNYLSRLGQLEEALNVIGEAVAIRRELAGTHPDAFLPGLAKSLNNQSNRLSQLERWEQALAVIEEAVTIRRELAAALPAAFLPNLATSLHNLAIILRTLGHAAEADSVQAEAVEIVSEPWNALGQPAEEGINEGLVPPDVSKLASQLDAMMSQAKGEELIAAARAAMPIWLTEYFDSASRNAHDLFTAAEAIGISSSPIPPRGWPDWLRVGILETLIAWGSGRGSTCLHAPSQTHPEPVASAAWKRCLVVCLECTHMLEVPGGKGSKEDQTCDGCGHVASGMGDDVILAGAVTAGPLTYLLGVCSSCRQALES